MKRYGIDSLFHCCLCIIVYTFARVSLFILTLDERAVFAPLTQLQVALYEAILGFPSSKSVIHSSDPCDCSSGKARIACCHKVSQTIFSVVLGFTCLLSPNTAYVSTDGCQLLLLLLIGDIFLAWHVLSRNKSRENFYRYFL